MKSSQFFEKKGNFASRHEGRSWGVTGKGSSCSGRSKKWEGILVHR